MILNRQRRVRVAMAPLEDFLARLSREVRLPADALTVCLVSDAEIARWNAVYRDKRGPTDVLSFPANGTQREQERRKARTKRSTQRNGRMQRNGRTVAIAPARSSTSSVSSVSYLGDIAIAPAVALRNARRFDRTLLEELRILILHGVLHLMGYDHESDHGEMDRRESRLRRQLGLS